MAQNTEKKPFNWATRFVLFLLCLTILLLVIYILNLAKQPQGSQTINNLVIDTSAKSQDKKVSDDELSGKMVYYSGIEDCVVGPNTAVMLSNPEENDFIYMTYEIKVNDEVIFQTGLIPAGDYVEWFPAEKLAAGATYTVNMREIPYYINKDGEQVPLTAPTNVVQITVTD